jgi:superfamily II DNA helicase RecQ
MSRRQKPASNSHSQQGRRRDAPLEIRGQSNLASSRVRIEVESTDISTGSRVTTINPLLPDRVAEAQQAIQDAASKGEIEQNSAIDKAVSILYPYPPRKGQRDALRHLIYRRKDLILIAKTSFGKSMILQAVSILMQKSITLVILPLDQIGKDQMEYITRIGGNPCHLNTETLDSRLLSRIRKAEFTHILLSPELAIGDKFRSVVIDPVVNDQLSLVVIDEAHLVSQWGRNFRTDYARLSQLRSLLGRSLPWFACSATLDDTTLKSLIERASFPKDVDIMRTSIDRPELLIKLGWIPRKSRSSASALRFLFDEGCRAQSNSVTRQQLIPKTIVFFDSKKEAYNSMYECRLWLQGSDQHLYPPKLAKEVIKVFHRDTAKFDKEATIAEFQKPGEDSSIRVVFATEALGLGVNLPDIPRAAQYGLPKSPEPAIAWQRGGRAGRDGKDGEMILLVDEWVQGERKSHRADESVALSDELEEPEDLAELEELEGLEELEDSGNSNPEKSKRKKLSDYERRGKLSDFWYKIANDDSCLRERFLDFFDEPSEYRTNIRKERCCSSCNEEYHLGKLDKHYLYAERGNALNKKRKKILESITKWADEQLPTLFPRAAFDLVTCCFLTDEQRTSLAKNAHIIFNLDNLQETLGPWHFFNTHGEALLKELRAAHHAASA